MRGPYAPWCVGSVFFPPQLLTSDVGPLLFNKFGSPQCLLSTGTRLEQSGATVSTSKLTENFIPRDLLQDHLESDASSHHGSQVHGNLLQGLKCSDDSVLVFFLYGRYADQVACTVCHRETGGKWCSVQTSLSFQNTDDSEQARWPVSPCFQHSIHQLSAVWARWSDNGGSECAIVAARSIYHVYFSTVSKEENRVQFISTAVSKFQSPVAHVTWNPHVDGEAAVVLENGELCLFDVHTSGNGNPSSVVDLVAKVTLKIPIQSLSPQPPSLLNLVSDNQKQVHHNEEQIVGSDQQTDASEKLQEVEMKWWRCEYGWLPQKLLVANSQNVFLVDLAEATNNCNPTFESSGRVNVDAETATSGIDILATVGASSCTRFCTLNSGKENFLALGRADNCEMFEFSVATERHLILFDARQPQTPILQWEHGLRQEPPSLLIMCPLSALRSSDDDGQLKGRAILAASFKSGDVRVFCFGSNVPRAESPLSNNPKKQKVDGHTWGNPTYAWETSSRLYAPLADVDDWRAVVSSSKGLYSQKRDGLFVPKSHKKRQNIAGIVLLPDNSVETWHEKKIFTLLQFTGWGELLAQTYEACHELREPSKSSTLSSDDASDSEQSTGIHESRDHDLRYATLPALLKYLRTGSVLAPPLKNFERVHKSETVDDAEALLTFGKDGMSGEANNDKWTTQKSSIPNPKLEKRIHQEALETHLKAFMQDLNVPLNMYEVAQKVLCMGLPERLASSAAGMPSDLNAKRHRGYRFPSVSPLLGVTAHSATSGDPKGKGDFLDNTQNSLTMEESVQGTVPIPLLLEIHNSERPIRGPSSSTGIGSQIDPRDIENCTGYEDLGCHNVRFENGHKLLVEGCQYVGSLIEKVVSKTDSTVLSLSKPTQELQGNGDGDADFQLLLYHLPEMGGLPLNPDRGDPDKSQSDIDGLNDIMEAGKAAGKADLGDTKKKSDTFSDDVHHKFVVGKASSKNQKEQPAEPYLKLDPKLCPIKLSFTSPGEVLEQEEVTALEGLQADFLQWQQSFSPNKSSY